MPGRVPIVPVGLTVLAVAIPLAVWAFMRDSRILPPDDYVQYWAAAKLLVVGGNPYDAGEIYPLELAAGRDTPFAILVLLPPWALPLVLPLALVPARLGQLLWLIGHTLLIVAAADWLWRRYGGAAAQRPIAWLVALLFAPTWMVLACGQITPLVLAGLCLMLLALDHDRPACAGLALVLASIKPHLVYLLWLALAVELLRGRGWAWRMLAGGVAGVAALLLVALWYNPHLLSEYARSFSDPRSPDLHPSLVYSHHSNLGFFIRHAIDPQNLRLQAIPAALTAPVFLWWYWRRGHALAWSERLPLLLLASALTTPYIYPYDKVLLLVPVVQAATWLTHAPPRSWFIAASAFVVLGQLAMLHQVTHEMVWIGPVVWLGYALVWRTIGRHGATADASATDPHSPPAR